MRWRENPERVAWVILTANFLACCALAVLLPLLTRQFLLHSTMPLTATVSPTLGTVQLQTRNAVDRVAVTEQRAVAENSLVVTDNLAQALISLSADGGGQALTTVRVFQNSALRLVNARRPRFSLSSDPYSYVLRLDNGRVRVAAAGTGGQEPRVVIVTPHGQFRLGEGTFDIAARTDESWVTVLAGRSVVTAAGAQVTGESGQRVNVGAGRAPDLPVPAEQNLVRDGRLEQELGVYWQVVSEASADRPEGQVTRELMGERPVVRITRRGEDGVPNMAGIRQTVEQNVQGHDALLLQLDLMLLHQSVPGGGIESSEYPLMVDLFYTDVYGKELHRFWGFYYYDLPQGSTWVQPRGEKVPLGTWVTYESPDLYELLRETPPARIKSITVYARGHDYESLVSEIALITR